MGKRFREVGDWKRKGEKFRSIRMCRPWYSNTLSQFYAEARKESGKDFEPDSLRVMQAALEGHLKVKIVPEIYYQKQRVPQFKKSPGGKSAKAKRRRERKTSEPIQKLNKRRRRRNPLEKWSAWQWKSPSTYQHDLVVADTTGGPDVEYDEYVTLVCWRLRYDFGRLKLKTMYGNASKIAVNAACGK